MRVAFFLAITSIVWWLASFERVSMTAEHANVEQPSNYQLPERIKPELRTVMLLLDVDSGTYCPVTISDSSGKAPPTEESLDAKLVSLGYRRSAEGIYEFDKIPVDSFVLTR